MQEQNTLITERKTGHTMSYTTGRIAMITKWLKENEHLLEATDAVQITLHVKRQKDNESVQGTILHLIK